MERVIITGPTGTVGTALAGLLTERGMEVVAVCRPGSPNIGNLTPHPLLRIVELDIRELGKLPELLEGPYQSFYHLAWEGTFGEGRNQPEIQLDNVRHTLDAVKAASELGCQVFVGAGSQAEFGHYEAPAGEGTLPHPYTLYGAAKVAAGEMSRVYAQSLGLRHIWVRIFSIFGRGDDPGTLISYLIQAFREGSRPSLTPGEQPWDYLYSKDAARALKSVAEKGRDGVAYSLGSGVIRPLRTYVEEIRDLVSPEGEIGFGERPYAPGQIMFLGADLEALNRDTGFRPAYTLREGLEDMLKRGMED
mgnify:CR=1 FL=1